MREVVQVPSTVGNFAEDKDLARKLRTEALVPALDAGDTVILDFAQVTYATQSFVHALLGEALKRFGEDVLNRIEFRNCSPQLRNVIELVVDYQLGGFSVPSEPAAQP
jgi:hypothetical protein